MTEPDDGGLAEAGKNHHDDPPSLTQVEEQVRRTEYYLTNEVKHQNSGICVQSGTNPSRHLSESLFA
jgi:hypothetical protein